MRFQNYLLCIIAAIAVIGCAKSGAHDPIQNPQVINPATENCSASTCSESTQHSLLGLWKVNVSEDHQSVRITPLRSCDFHFNVLQMVETQNMSKCLTIDNVKTGPSGIIQADLTLWHPFPGNYNLTGFDVRGIFITGADYSFPINVRKISWGDTLPRMIYPDGYTPLFNPTEYPESPTESPLLTYTTGKYAIGTNLTSTLNPYLAFCKDVPRKAFRPGEHETKTIRFYAPDGAFAFGYAISACWAPPGKEVSDPIKEFPPEANCNEPYSVEALIWPGIEPEAGSSSILYVKVYDHQGLDTIERVVCECPNLFSNAVELDYLDSDGDEGSHLYYGSIANEVGAIAGYYPLLVRVDDTGSDPNFGPMSAWMIATARVGIGWVRVWGGIHMVYGYDSFRSVDVAVDHSGYSYVVGTYNGSVDFDPGPGFSYGGAKHRRVSLSKFNPRGQLVWFDTWGCYGYGCYNNCDPICVTADPFGNAYVSGYFKGKIDFDPGPDKVIIESSSYRDGFLSKFDPDGNFLWVRTWTKAHETSDSSYCSIKSIATDTGGNILIGGCFKGQVDFDPGPGVVPFDSPDNYDLFLIKLDSNGNYLWVRIWVDDKSITEIKLSMTVEDEILMVSNFSGTLDLDPGPDTVEHSSNGEYDALMIKLSPGGEYLFGLTWGGAGNDSTSDVFCSSYDDIYVIGSFIWLVDFDPGPGIHEEDSGDSISPYLCKFNSSGEFQQVCHWHGADSVTACHVAAADFGNIFVTGNFEEWIDLKPGWENWIEVSNGKTDIYLSIFDSDCNFIKGMSWGSGKKDEIKGLATNGHGMFLTGDFVGTIDLDLTDYVEEFTSIGSSGYLIKLLPDGSW